MQCCCAVSDTPSFHARSAGQILRAENFGHSTITAKMGIRLLDGWARKVCEISMKDVLEQRGITSAQ